MTDDVAGIAGVLFVIFCVAFLIWFGRRLDGIAADTKRAAEALEKIASSSMLDPDIAQHVRRKEIRGADESAGRERGAAALYGRGPGK